MKRCQIRWLDGVLLAGFVLLLALMAWRHLDFFPSPVYKCCHKAPDELENIREMIAALGVVCFALSYISSAGAQRVKGLLMEDVISDCYPHYGLVFLLYGVFAVLGMYSCVLGKLCLARLCLGSVLLCAIYAAEMAYQVCFSLKGRDRLVERYLKGYLQNPSALRLEYVHRLGSYVGERYNTYSLALNEWISDREDSRSVAMLLTELLKLNPRTGQNLESAEESFQQLFCGSHVQPEEILFSLPFYEDICGDVKEEFRACAVLWASVLPQIQDEERQAAFVGELLARSPQHTVLSCGLVRHLHDRLISHGAEEGGWNDCVRFITRVANIAENARWEEGQKRTRWWVRLGRRLRFGWQKAPVREEDRPEGNRPELLRDKVLGCCQDMAVLVLCLALLEEASASRTQIGEEFVSLVRNEAHRRRSALRTAWDFEGLSRSLSIAYMILESLSSPDIQKPGRRELYQQVPMIREALRQCLSV